MGINVTKIVLTGGPCAGKSTGLAILRQWLEDRGFRVITQWETATQLINAGVTPADGFLFQKAIFKIQQETENALNAAAHIIARQSLKKVVVLLDRGLLDYRAFVSEFESNELLTFFNTSKSWLLARYDMIIHMDSVAKGAEAYYTLENNPARQKNTLEGERAVDDATWFAYQGHPHHVRIDNSTDFPTKLQRVLQATARVLGMPEPLEIERKWLVYSLAIPDQATAVRITQAYLTSPEPNVEHRIRRRELLDGGAPTYYFTIKRPVEGKPSVREEVEHQITEEEWNEKLKHQDPYTVLIEKTRYIWEFKGHTLEYDVFHGYNDGLQLLEVETTTETEKIELPNDFIGQEVTGNKNFSNRVLAVK